MDTQDPSVYGDTMAVVGRKGLLYFVSLLLLYILLIFVFKELPLKDRLYTAWHEDFSLKAPVLQL